MCYYCHSLLIRTNFSTAAFWNTEYREASVQLNPPGCPGCSSLRWKIRTQPSPPPVNTTVESSEAFKHQANKH